MAFAENLDVLIEFCENYLLEFHEIDLLEILQKEDSLEHYSVTINFLNLFENNADLGNSLLVSPIETLDSFDKALLHASSQIYEQNKRTDTIYGYLTLKNNLHCRISGLPVCPELLRERLPKCADIGSYLSITGTVIRTGPVKLLEMEKSFVCNSCKHVFDVEADFEQHYSVCRAAKCPNRSDCNKGFTAMSGKGAPPEKCRNFQEMKVQEQAARLKVGTVPRSMWVVLLDDLVDTCKPGDDVVVSGVVQRRWRPLIVDVKSDIELTMKANHIQVTNAQHVDTGITQEMKDEFHKFWEEHVQNPLAARDKILASFCPQVYGLYMVKLAVTLVLIGGVQRVDDSGTKVRGESHLLLIGDPGTGKSQMMKYACKVMPRSILTTGIGSTTAGLTVTAVKDGGEWHLEAGALVLADGGLCCIDEFSSIRSQDRASIHEAMEQQTISVAKAGLVCKLNTRCTIIASTNPKGQYDTNQSVSVNTAIASPLLSRFDVILVLLDSQNQEWDEIVSSYILSGKRDKGFQQKNLWPLEKIRAYLIMVKNLNPVLNEDAMRILSEYYRAQRKGDECQATRTTTRFLESIIRLSQAHAKLMMRKEVKVQDAVVAISLMEASMLCNSSYIDGSNTLHMIFPDDPKKHYQVQAKQLLQRLGLQSILRKEMELWKNDEKMAFASSEHTMQSTEFETDTCLDAILQEDGKQIQFQDKTSISSNDDIINFNKVPKFMNILTDIQKSEYFIDTKSRVTTESKKSPSFVESGRIQMTNLKQIGKIEECCANSIFDKDIDEFDFKESDNSILKVTTLEGLSNKSKYSQPISKTIGKLAMFAYKGNDKEVGSSGKKTSFGVGEADVSNCKKLDFISGKGSTEVDANLGSEDVIFPELIISPNHLLDRPSIKRKTTSPPREQHSASQAGLFSIGSKPSLDEFDLCSFTRLNHKRKKHS